ncbi:MAG: SDR family oxidoreductase [Geodermatophilaceae bacterium]|nr:SDR family oxidoreductase [Geodermatophilaceae bacterium]MDQ3465239.1 SDR family oxidoreductase [Actinomycetota bacterium]
MTTVLLTGASSGIGAATALALDRAGMTVFAGFRDPSESGPLQKGASERLHVLTLDITDEQSIAAAVAAVTERLGDAGLDAVINNAGEGIPGPLEIIALDQLREQLEVNVVGQVAVTQAVLPLLRRASGRVIFVGSIGGKVAVQFAGPYHASKYAMEAIADCWRQELAPDGIRVSLIEPGPIATPIWAKGAERIDALLAAASPQAARYADRLRSFQETLRSQGKSGSSPAEVADAILQAVTAQRPRSRYAVGAAAKVVSAVRQLIPDRLLDAVGKRIAS